MLLWLIAAFMFAPLAFAQDHGMRFTPAQITVKQGEIVRFESVNKGQVMHEMVRGTLDDPKKHAELMKKNPGMPHDAPHLAHVAPGKSGTIGWQFTKPGEFFFGKVTVQSDRAVLRTLLSDAQLARYDALRGYAAR